MAHEAIEVQTKLCKTCEELKSLNDFYKSKNVRDGFSSSCKVCDKLRTKKWRAANKEKERASKQKWYRKNREKELKRMKQYKEDHREELLEYSRHYNKKYREAHRDELNEYCRLWRKQHPEKNKEYYQNAISRDKEAINMRARKNYPKYKERKKEYNRINKKKRNAQARQRYNECIEIRMNHRLSSDIRASLTSVGSSKKGKSWLEILPYTLTELMQHLESQFVMHPIYGYSMSWENYGKDCLVTFPEEWEIEHIIPKVAFKFSEPEDESFQECWSLTNLRPYWRLPNKVKFDMPPDIWEQRKYELLPEYFPREEE